MSVENILYNPNMAVLVLPEKSATTTLLSHNPHIRYKKTLAGGCTIVYVNRAEVDRFVNGVRSYGINLFPSVFGLLGTQELGASGIPQMQQTHSSLKGSGVLLGFIDTGIDYTNGAFRNEDGSSKIRYIWDQTIRGSSPDDFPYGTEYCAAQLNQALESENPHEIVPHMDTVGHGTFLASLSGGRAQDGGFAGGAAPDAEIIAVKLRRARPVDCARSLVPAAQENAFSSDDFMMGVQYIIDKATQLQKPVVICVSLGSNSGPYDGFTALAGYLQHIAGIVGVAICAAAGNEGLVGHHTHGNLAAGGEHKNIELRVGPKPEDIYLSICNSATCKLSVSVASPTGEQVEHLPARSGMRYSQMLASARATVDIEYTFPIGLSGAQLTRIKILSATPGRWAVSLHTDTDPDGSYNAWLPLTGFIGPETVFVNPSPNYSIVTPANAFGVIACGAYSSRDNIFAEFSSQGPLRMGAILPDLVAPGVSVDGTLPDGPGVMSGTSASAAFTAGACALMLQWGIVEKNDTSLNSFRIRRKLIKGCERNPDIEYPNNQWGYGKLNLFNAFRAMN